MKNLVYISLIFIGACGSFDQEAFQAGQSANEVDYTVPTTLPATEAEFSTLLVGEQKKRWLGREFTLNGFLGVQECRLDDTMTFNDDGTYQYDGGKMSCGGDDVLSRSGTYRIDFDNGRLIFDEGTANEVVALVKGLGEGVVSLRGEVDIFGESVGINGVYTVVTE